LHICNKSHLFRICLVMWLFLCILGLNLQILCWGSSASVFLIFPLLCLCLVFIRVIQPSQNERGSTFTAATF
jgi:hypothetical protein